MERDDPRHPPSPRTERRASRGVVCLTALGAAFGCAESSSPLDLPLQRTERPVEIARARAVRADDSRSYPGTVRAPETARVAFRVPGTIVRYPVEVGQSVRAGEVLARMDDAEYEIEVRESEAAVAGARTALAVAERNLARTRRLFESDVATLEQLDAAVQRRDGAQAELAAARERLDAARLRRSYTRLEAPVNSWVVELLAEEGETVGAGTPVVVLGSRASFEIGVEVPETSVVNLDVGHPVRVTFPRIDAAARGRVKEVARAPASGTVLYPVVLTVVEPPDQLRVGMTATARFEGTPASLDAPVSVPLDAVVGRRTGEPEVFVVETSTNGDAGAVRVARRRAVALDAVTPGGVAVTRGLAEGEAVVVAGTDLLEDGDRVTTAAPIARLPELSPRIEDESR
jgi:multidrug efflux system membrane fusion protein